MTRALHLSGAHLRPPGRQIWTGLWVAAAAIAARALIGVVVPGPVPFPLLFPAVLAATLIAGWQAGVICLLIGGPLALMLFVEPARSLRALGVTSATGMSLLSLSAIAIIVLADRHRRALIRVRALTDAAAAHRQALAQSEERLRMAVEAAGVGIWEWRLETGEMIYSAEARAICGFTASEPLDYERVVAVTHPEDLPRTLAQADRALDPGLRDAQAYDYRVLRPDGEERRVMAYGRAVFEPRDGVATAVRYVGTIVDVTERRAAEERVQLLNREIDHRANNLMAVIQGTVMLSRAPTAQTLKEIIIGRLHALARAHQLLSETRWIGASLRRLVEDELLAFGLGEPDRISFRGPDVALGPSAAQSLAMAIHELATNAAKHGALSTPDGRVDVCWRDAGGRLTLRWTEAGGPPVRPPEQSGFGTTLLGRALTGLGAVELDWRPAGIVCEIEIASPSRSRVG